VSKLKPCPKCGGPVEHSSSRDLNIYQSYIECENCDLYFFQTESIAFLNLPNLDYESMVMKYNAWCETNPKQYCEDFWE